MSKEYNCEINGKKYFKKKKVIGHNIDGTPQYKYFYGDGKKDCNKKIEEYMSQMEKGLDMDKQSKTIAQEMYSWLFEFLYLSSNMKSSSFEKHEANFRNYIKNSKIGYLQISNITSLHFQKYYNELFEKRNRYNKSKIWNRPA